MVVYMAYRISSELCEYLACWSCALSQTIDNVVRAKCCENNNGIAGESFSVNTLAPAHTHTHTNTHIYRPTNRTAINFTLSHVHSKWSGALCYASCSMLGTVRRRHHRWKWTMDGGQQKCQWLCSPDKAEDNTKLGDTMHHTNDHWAKSTNRT